MAKREFDFWNGYLEARKEEINALEEKRQALEGDVEVKEVHGRSLVHYSHQIIDHDLRRI